MKYKIYSDYGTHRLVDTVNTLEEAINVIDNIIYKEDAHYLIIKEDIEPDIIAIRSIEEFEQYKEIYKGKEKTYGIIKNTIK